MSTVAINEKSWSQIVGKSRSAKIENATHQDEIVAVIEVHHEQEPVRNYSKQVDPRALQVAEHFYTKHMDAVLETSRRSALEELYNNVMREYTRAVGFPVMLYALAQGMKVVNVFNRGQQLEWHKPRNQYLKASRNTKKIHKLDDGWISIGAPVVEVEKDTKSKTDSEYPGTFIPATELLEVVVEKMDEPVNVEEKTTTPEKRTTTPEKKMTNDEIIDELHNLKNSIRDHDNGICSLVCFHNDHNREIQNLSNLSCEVAKRISKYHEKAKNELADFLDQLQNELDTMRSRQSELVKMLKE